MEQRPRFASVRLHANGDELAPSSLHDSPRGSTDDSFEQDHNSSPPKLTPSNSTSSSSTSSSTQHPPEHRDVQQPRMKPGDRHISTVFKLFHPSQHQRTKSPDEKRHSADQHQPQRKLLHFPSFRSIKPPSLEKMYGLPSNVIGSGTHSEVITVQKQGVMYAVKRLRKQRRGETTKEYKRKLYAEFVISSTLHHENVISMMDLISDDRDRLCLVMEYCGGGDLLTWIDAVSAQPNFSEINCFFKQLVNGVEYMHSMGIAHRDLKPENLLISNDGTILKITDFDHVEVFLPPGALEPQMSYGLFGSEPYIPPEQFTAWKTGYDSTKVDIWAIGITLYAMMFNSIPWHRASAENVRYAVYLHVTQPSPPTEESGPGQQQRNHNGYLPFDQILDDGQRDIVYEILNPDAHCRPTAAQLQQRPWFRDLSVCRPGEPCKGHATSLACRRAEGH